MDFEVFASHVQSKHCERLLKGICKGKPCSLQADGTYPVEFEHIVARDAGGSSTLANTRLLCANENRAKSTRTDPHYHRLGFFDQELHDHNLRPAQKAFGSDQVASSYRALFRELPNELFSVFMLLGWVVGTGKTLGMAGILLAINKLRREHEPGGWRIKRVLWLVHQDTLVDATGTELGGTTIGKRVIESELVEHGIVDAAPRLRKVRKPEDWILGMDEDIVLATPQSLWTAEGRVLSRSRKAQILAGFDAVIVDECQFAIERYLEIFELAPKALKFVMTSTPFDKDMNYISGLGGGAYRERFRLFSAVGLDQDIHKVIRPVFRDWNTDREKVDAALARYEATHDELVFPEVNTANYHRVRGGIATVGQGLNVIGEIKDNSEHLDSIRVMAVINRCREIASAPSWGYDPHVMLKFGGIRECRHFAKELNESAERERRPEWGAVEVFAGAKTNAKLGSDENPWMLAKRNNGRVLKGSKRFACTVDIGQFGINQPACSIIGWIDTSMSFIEIVQRMGRPIRRRDPMNGEVHIVWDAAKDVNYAFTIRLHKAVEYILNMKEDVEAAFLPLRGLDKSIPPLPEIATEPDAIPRARKLEIAEIVGSITGGQDMDPEELISAIDVAVYGGSGRMPDRVKEFVTTIATPSSEESRMLSEKLFLLPRCLTPITYIQDEKPPEVFTDGEVEEAINKHPDFSTRSKLLELEAYKAGDPEVRQNWQQFLYEQRRREYAVPEASYHPREILGVVGSKETSMTNMAGSYKERLLGIFRPAIKRSCDMAGIDSSDVSRKAGAAIIKALNRSAARSLGLKNFTVVTLAPYKDQIAHALCAPEVEQTILSMSYGVVMDEMRAYLPGLNALFGQQIAQVSEHLNGAVEHS